jgi:hypothetical protein
MEILMVDPREGTRHSHLHVRKHPAYQLEGFISTLYPKMRGYLDPAVGANLRFREEGERRVRRRSSGSLAGLPPGGQL